MPSALTNPPFFGYLWFYCVALNEVIQERIEDVCKQYEETPQRVKKVWKERKKRQIGLNSILFKLLDQILPFLISIHFNKVQDH